VKRDFSMQALCSCKKHIVTYYQWACQGPQRHNPPPLSFVLSRRRPCIKRRRSLDTSCTYGYYLAAAVRRARVCMLHRTHSQPAVSTSTSVESATIHEGSPGPIATMSRSKEGACNLVPGLTDPDLSLRVRAAAQQANRPVAARSGINRLDLDS